MQEMGNEKNRSTAAHGETLVRSPSGPKMLRILGGYRLRLPKLSILGDLSRLETGSADRYSLRNAAYESTNLLKVRHPATLGNVVGVGNAVSRNRLLAAYVTHFSHNFSSTPLAKVQ